MTQIQDFSSLKREGFITIPLNGETYEAVADPPAEVSLQAIGAVDSADLTAVASALEKVGADGAGLSTDDPATLAAIAKAAGAGFSHTRRIIRFFEQVLTPESLERWVTNMRPPDPEWSKAKQKAHQAKQIVLPQIMEVYKALQAEYSRRPTTPSLSSANGHGGTGGTSTAGQPAEA